MPKKNQCHIYVRMWVRQTNPKGENKPFEEKEARRLVSKLRNQGILRSDILIEHT